MVVKILLSFLVTDQDSNKLLLLFYFKQTLYPTTGKDHDSNKSEVNWEVLAAGYDRKTQHYIFKDCRKSICDLTKFDLPLSHPTLVIRKPDKYCIMAAVWVRTISLSAKNRLKKKETDLTDQATNTMTNILMLHRKKRSHVLRARTHARTHTVFQILQSNF